MICDRIQLSISAVLDGEDAPEPPSVVANHVATCAGCRAYRDGAESLHREVRVAAAPAVPDLTPQILLSIGADARHADAADPEARGLRLVVALLGLLQLGVALPALLFGEDAGLPVHTARHLGSFGVALGIGLLVAAWRPERVAGLLPLAVALVACLVVTCVLDVTTAHVPPSNELNHAIEVVGLVSLWLLSRTPAADRRSHARLQEA